MYQRIMDDVIESCQVTFEEDGVNQHTLDDLRKVGHLLEYHIFQGHTCSGRCRLNHDRRKSLCFVRRYFLTLCHFFLFLFLFPKWVGESGELRNSLRLAGHSHPLTHFLYPNDPTLTLPNLISQSSIGPIRSLSVPLRYKLTRKLCPIHT